MPRYMMRVLIALALAVPGIALLPVVLPRPAILPDEIPKIAMAANPLLFALIAALVGAWAAPKAGLHSILILGRGLSFGAGAWRACLPWLLAGVAAGLVVAGLDQFTRPWWNTGNLAAVGAGASVPTFLLALTYGGVSEEILLRWGVMALVALGTLRLLPRTPALWAAALAAAALFALGHLPALIALAGELTPALVARTLVWNFALGLMFGLAFARTHLEAAMGAHMGAHLGFALWAMVGPGLVP